VFLALVIYSEQFARHNTGYHPERPERVTKVAEALREAPGGHELVCDCFEPAAAADLQTVHEGKYVLHVRDFCASGGGKLDPDTFADKSTYEVARYAAGAVMLGVEKVTSAGQQHVFALVRPPGHHALPDTSGGFCIFNNVAIGARLAQRRFGVRRVIVVDFDVHHGNGTQHIFYSDPDVAFVSLHRFPFYPGSGRPEETGSGKGVGFTLNVPVAFGVSSREYLALFEEAVRRGFEKVNPELVFVSAGFDAYHLDPIAGLNLETADYGRIGRLLKELADEHCRGRVVSVLEGGYCIPRLAECVRAYLDGFE